MNKDTQNAHLLTPCGTNYLFVEDHKPLIPDDVRDALRSVDTTRKPPANSVFWNPGNKVVQCHRTGEIDHRLTNIERARRGLPVPWAADMAERETKMRDIP